MSAATEAPNTIRGAGILVALQGIAGIVFAVLLIVKAPSTPGVNPYGEAAYFTVIAGGVLACGIGLLLGKRWARSPAIVAELLLLGVALYAAGPSSRPEYGFPIGVLCVVALALLLGPKARDWFADLHEERDTSE
ncbi:hypothetical protein EV193_110189 [Herbihabitans rhizosphaerae]|uniref:Integral membrane protein n=1 Tax=Herbihabitans rhizosphaerae TaxID=1872711 RepID=A0A4Q7KG39_9PSEU|nr:hypothetical protein [Herbihabitans rhizosphaerae]RZS34039.1 hypothetical protein EV193_110189 [Herbihabitans rhizosphaerae]